MKITGNENKNLHSNYSFSAAFLKTIIKNLLLNHRDFLSQAIIFQFFFFMKFQFSFSYGNNKSPRICYIIFPLLFFFFCLTGRCTRTLRCFINRSVFLLLSKAKCSSHEKVKTSKRNFQVLFPYKNQQQLLFI